MGNQHQFFPVQILAHHPDFPTRQDAAEEGVAVYQPFSRMLQFALEPLILAAAGSEQAEPPGESDLLQSWLAAYSSEYPHPYRSLSLPSMED